MSRRGVGLVDYGVGNLASVKQALLGMGYRCEISGQPDELDKADLLLLPGVGTFPVAMEGLKRNGLCEFLRDWAARDRPMLGICLGMQLFAESSTEIHLTEGLGLIPGQVAPLGTPHWHIGWNRIQTVRADDLLQAAEDSHVYFNHSYVFQTTPEHQLATARVNGSGTSVTVAVRRGNLVGLQFHPEKSQAAGRKLLIHLIESLCHDQ